MNGKGEREREREEGAVFSQSLDEDTLVKHLLLSLLPVLCTHTHKKKTDPCAIDVPLWGRENCGEYDHKRDKANEKVNNSSKTNEL